MVAKLTIVIGILIVGLILFSGCLSGRVTESYFASEARTIDTFNLVTEGEVFRAYFSLQDKDGLNTVADGRVEIVIKDDSEEVVFVKSFGIKQSDFVDYQIMLTGIGVGKAYEWRIPKNEIKKGSSISGDVELKFTLENGTIFKNETSIYGLEAYTEEEIKQMEDEIFAKTATTINNTISKGNFTVTVIKAGFISEHDYGVKKDYLRVDLRVKNVSQETETFTPSGMVVLEGTNQYEKSYGGTLDVFSQIYPGVEKEGYVLFENVPNTAKNLKLAFELGYDPQYNRYTYEYDINLQLDGNITYQQTTTLPADLCQNKNCNDENPCTNDYCSESTNYQCAHENLNGEVSGCSGYAGICKTSSCVTGTCQQQTKTNCCGNNQCETGESYLLCPTDCTCAPNWQCTSWSTCSEASVQTRICSDYSVCGTTEGKPIELQSCTPPESPKQYEWYQLQEFTGVGATQTDLFMIPSDRWRFTWSCKPGTIMGQPVSPDLALMNIFIYTVESEMLSNPYILMGKCTEGELANVYQGKKEFYFSINVANVESWKIIVEAQREIN